MHDTIIQSHHFICIGASAGVIYFNSPICLHALKWSLSFNMRKQLTLNPFSRDESINEIIIIYFSN